MESLSLSLVWPGRFTHFPFNQLGADRFKILYSILLSFFLFFDSFFSREKVKERERERERACSARKLYDCASRRNGEFVEAGLGQISAARLILPQPENILFDRGAVVSLEISIFALRN